MYFTKNQFLVLCLWFVVYCLLFVVGTNLLLAPVSQPVSVNGFFSLLKFGQLEMILRQTLLSPTVETVGYK